MSTLANILPAAGNDSFNNGVATAFSGPSGQTGEPFDHLMARALSPPPTAANPAVEQDQQTKDAADSSSPPTKNSKSSAPASAKDHAKPGSENLNSVAQPSAPLEINFVATNPESVPIQIVAPVAAKADQKNGLSAQTVADASVSDLKTAVAKNSADRLTASPEVKATSAVEAKIPSPAVSQNQPTVETNSTNSKNAGLTTANPTASPLLKDPSGDLTLPKPDVEPIVQSSQPELSALQDSASKTSAQAQSDVNGTSVAQQDVPMNKTGKTDKTSRSPGKILPGATVSVAWMNNLPARANFSEPALARVGLIGAGAADNSSPTGNAAGEMPLAADSVVSVGISEARSRALERTQDLILQHTMRLSSSSAESLQVVIKPGAGTQLSLELRQRGDGVEAQATLQRGDFEHLNQHWPALQQQLEQRGIRLASLACDENFSGGGSHAFQKQPNNASELDAFSAEEFSESAPAVLLAPLAANAGMNGRWESWA
jgi:hypothetical protein